MLGHPLALIRKITYIKLEIITDFGYFGTKNNNRTLKKIAKGIRLVKHGVYVVPQQLFFEI